MNKGRQLPLFFCYTRKSRGVICAVIAGGKPSYILYARNGYTSMVYGSYPKSIGIKKIIFKSLTENKMMSYDPSLDTPPVYRDGVL